MLHTNLYARTISFGLVIGASTLLVGCQGSGQQAIAENQHAALPAPSTIAASAQISPYTPGATPENPLSYCNLEAVGTVAFGADPVVLAAAQQNVFRGWIDASGLAKPSYWLRFDDQSANRHLQAPLALTVQRPDVASAHAGAPLVSGFSQKLPVNALPPGHYHVYVAVSSDGETYTCDNGRRVEVNS